MNRTQWIKGGVLLTIVLAGGLSGCFRDRKPIYVDSEEVPRIEVPADLSSPDASRTYMIPGVSLPQLAAEGDQARPPVVLPSADVESARSRIRFGPRGLYLEVDDELDSVWRRLGFTLNRGGMNVRVADQNKHRYIFRFDHEPVEVRRRGLARLAFWRGSEVMDFRGVYRIELVADGEESTRVELLTESGDIIQMERSEYVLMELQKRLG